MIQKIIIAAIVLVCLAHMSTTKLIRPYEDTQNSDNRHHNVEDTEPGPQNKELEDENPSSNWAPQTDKGGQLPFKYPFSFAQKSIYSGGWTRQETVRDLAISKQMAGVQMRLIKGGVRELHWHAGAEWAYTLYGKCRITAVDQNGRGFVEDVSEGDLWLFPGGVPHSIQGVGDDGCFFLLVFDDGNFNEFETFLLTDWLRHVPKSVLAKNFQVNDTVFKDLPEKEMYIFASEEPRDLSEEKRSVASGTGYVPSPFAFFTSKMSPNKTMTGGHVKIVDANNFPVTSIAAAIVTLKPGALRELHWHPNADEWQYYVSGNARMGVFIAGGKARTMDFTAGDVGYIEKSTPHYVENTGTTDLVFLEVFPSATYEDISLAEWVAHTPSRLINEHLFTGEDFIDNIAKTESVIQPV